MTGRDPLGLNRVSDNVTDYLLTGIITTTDRARYYACYCWAVWHVNKVNQPKRLSDFIDAFRRREAVIALATISNNPDTSPDGVLAAQYKLLEGKQNGEIDTDFKVLPSNELGAYSQYYEGSLINLGLIQRTETGIRFVTEGDAKELALIYDNTIENTPYIKKQLFNQKYIDINDLEKSKKYLTLDAIFEPFANRERKKLIEIFFAIDNKTQSGNSFIRRCTLAQIIHIISEYQKNGSSPNMKNVDKYLVFSPYYYDALWLDQKASVPYSSLIQFSSCKSLWRQYCLHQFLTQALESLLYSILEILSLEPSGLGLKDITSDILQPKFFSFISQITGDSCNRPCDLLSALGVNNIPNAQLSDQLQKKFSLLDLKSEYQIIEIDDKSYFAMAAKCVLLLSVIYGKWRGVINDTGYDLISENSGDRLWTKRIFPFIDKWLSKEYSWHEALAEIISIFILEQHYLVRLEKRRPESSWLHTDKKLIFKDQDYRPVWRASRHRNAVSILNDLGLLVVDANQNISVTSEGENLLNRILRQGHNGQ